ncbi:MAG: DNA repair protein RadC [Bacteroidia bacterium]|nr:DNA repair protein RadC [Bacteroidia bacterium]
MEGYLPITQWNEDDRPREKLLLKGRNALSDAELLAILLGTGSRYMDKLGNWVTRSAVDLARDILHKTGNNLVSLARMTPLELQEVQGVGMAKAITILAAIELGARRKLASEVREKITSYREAQAIFRSKMEDLTVEQFWVIFLNTTNQILQVSKLSEGGISSTVVDPGPIFKMAVLLNARGIILGHNHPSGVPKPSELDKGLTRKLVQAGNVLDITVHDHLIIASQGYFSFSEEGLM